MTPAEIAPRFAHDYPELAQVAAHLLAGREAGYPVMVGKGAMTAEQATAGIAAARAIAADWAAVVAGTPLPESPVTQDEKRRTLETAAARADQLAAAKAGQEEVAHYAACVRALLWHQQDFFTQSRIAFLHSVTLQLRQMARALHDIAQGRRAA